MNNDFLTIKNETDTSADLCFYGDIVSSEWHAWDTEDQYPDQVRRILNQIKNKDINIYINSGGGDVFAGIAIYNMIKRHNGRKTVYVDGLAASIASIIALAGDEIHIPANAFFMIHKPAVVLIGYYNSDDLLEYAELLDTLQDGIMNTYYENMADGVDKSTIEQMVNDETWMIGTEAAKYFSKIIAEDAIQAVACASQIAGNYLNTPKNIINNIKEEKELSNVNQPSNAENVLKTGHFESETILNGIDVSTIMDNTIRDELTADNIKNAYPQLYNEIYNKGISDERERLQAVDKLADTVDSEFLNKAKYTEPMNAEKAAYAAMVEGKLKVKGCNMRFLDAIEEDSAEANKVKSIGDVTEDDDNINVAVTAANEGRR